MKLTETKWGRFKGKYKNHYVEVRISETNDYKWAYMITKNDSHVFTSSYNGLVYDSKEDASEAAVRKIDEFISV